MHFAPWIQFNSNFDTALLCKLDLNQTYYNHFCFQSLIGISKGEVQFLHKSRFYSDAEQLVIWIGSKNPKESLSSWQKFRNPIGSQVNQPIKACTPSATVVFWVFTHPQQRDGTWENCYSYWLVQLEIWEKIDSKLLLQLSPIWR